MSADTNPPKQSSWRNWTSLSGLVIMLGGFFAFFLLFLLDALAHFSNPYVGVLTYLVAPGIWVLGFLLFIIGVIIRRRRLAHANGGSLPIRIDLSRTRDRKILGIFAAGSLCFLLITSIASYHSYHFTESVQFCGKTCHTVMQPELTAYEYGPHARVSCAECHIGAGATWYVRSKLSGVYQVYATMTEKYPRPVPTPIKNLRPAQETCEQCHWPKKFVGSLDRTFDHFLADETNTQYATRLLLKVGGGDPTYGPVGGIHWHMNVANKIEYVATDALRQRIPWVRMTDSQGVVTEYKVPGFTNDISKMQIRRMDCMDCHNRPAHRFQTPNDAVNQAISLGKIDRSLPLVKSNAVYVLTQSYTNETQALQAIATGLANAYPGEARVKEVIDNVQQIYSLNFFPKMKADWRAYPDNIGHKDWPGCFRCHDGKHKTSDGKQTITGNDKCNACHVILSQGSGTELEKLSAHGQDFKHPEDDYDPAYMCTDCHNGGL